MDGSSLGVSWFGRRVARDRIVAQGLQSPEELVRSPSPLPSPGAPRGAWLYMKEPVRLNYLWAALCLCGAVFFVFKR